jgi:hypothetical protein
MNDEEGFLMKKLFDPLLSAPWLNEHLPDPIIRPMKKTPWYRQPWLMTARWVPVALAVPLAAFIIWKGVPKIRSRFSKNPSL